MKNLMLGCSIVLIITLCAVYFALGRYFSGKSISNMSVTSKLKSILMIACPAFLMYASYLIYFKAEFMTATICLIVTAVLSVCSQEL